MPLHPLDCLLVLLLTTLFFGLLVELTHFVRHPAPPKASRRDPRLLRPRTPDDCQHCRVVAGAPPVVVARSVAPYAQRKSRRGRKKTIDTRGHACPIPDCNYRGITDRAVHALVGYSHHGQAQPIQDLYCQACRPLTGVFRQTPHGALRSQDLGGSRRPGVARRR